MENVGTWCIIVNFVMLDCILIILKTTTWNWTTKRWSLL